MAPLFHAAVVVQPVNHYVQYPEASTAFVVTEEFAELASLSTEVECHLAQDEKNAK